MYTKELIFDIPLGAFYKNDIKPVAGPYSPYVVDYVKVEGQGTSNVDRAVVTNDDVLVEDSTNDPVVVSRRIAYSGDQQRVFLRYLTYDWPYMLFSYYHDQAFRDWTSHDGVGADAEAFMLTGEAIVEDTQRKKQAPHITCHFKKTETGDPSTGKDSSCLLQTRWDFATSLPSNKISDDIQVYRHVKAPSGTLGFDNGFGVVSTKTKLMGRGRALSLLFKTEPYHDLQLYGWGTKFAGNSNV